jgi:phenylalanyl-tRNA synthetase beta chain
MRVPLSWLRDFAAFPLDADQLVATLDDLGLVVEDVESIGEGLEGVVVTRVEEIAPIKGADKIRRVVVDGGLEIVCGADNFVVGDLVPLARVGVTLPGGFEISRRTLKGVTSNGMLCSGRELGLSDDQAGLLILTEVEGVRPGMALTEALGIEKDIVFDITVEGNRPDAWCVAGIAKDLAARLKIPFTLPMPTPPVHVGPNVETLASLRIDDLDLCPRMTVRVLTDVAVGPSPRWMARRLTLAGMRSINNVVDASNYVMLELGQPTHPYDLEQLGGAGLLVRRATPGETIETLDGVQRVLGTPGRGLGDTGEDCVICDAENTPVGIGGIMGGASSEISETTTAVLLETAYFTPMVIARTAKRLGLRTEASARFERGCDPWGIDRAALRFCELVDATVADGVLDVQGEVPDPFRLSLSVEVTNARLGTSLDADEIAGLLEPIGFGCEINADVLEVTVPTNRPDVRVAPHGIDDVIEEVARTYSYSRIARRQPSWPQPGGLSAHQRERRQIKEVLCGLGSSEAWTPTFLADEDHHRVGLQGPAVEVANPLVSEESVLRRTMLPGLLRAIAYNLDRRQVGIRLFEVGTVFTHPDNGGGRSVQRSGAGGQSISMAPGERELLSVVLAGEGDDARTAVVAWNVLGEALRVAESEIVADSEIPGLHPTRSARLRSPDGVVLGAIGEVDPDVLASFSIAGRVGWLEVDLGLLAQARRLTEESMPISRFPSSDIDLAFLVPDTVTAGTLQRTLREAGGELLESISLFDVFRIDAAQRSLAFRLRFCALDRTLTDVEVGDCRQRCIDAAQALGASLR